MYLKCVAIFCMVYMLIATLIDMVKYKNDENCWIGFGVFIGSCFLGGIWVFLLIKLIRLVI